MSHATAHTISLQGAHVHLIDVQADLSDGTTSAPYRRSSFCFSGL